MTNSYSSYTPLEKGQIIPAFTLPGADGMPHSPWDYKQREHLLLLFLQSTTTSEECTLLRTFAEHYTDFREETCAILAITADPVIKNLQAQEKLRLPFPLLADPKGEVITRYTGWDRAKHPFTPDIVLADRYNVLYLQGSNEELSLSELVETLQYMNRLCIP